jgi:SOS-response transcriptional repressor LexA
MTVATERAKLTLDELRILAFMVDQQKRFGRPPSGREIGVGIGGASPNTVSRLLRSMVAKGYVRALAPGTVRRYVGEVEP